jgi:hypothetical protein
LAKDYEYIENPTPEQERLQAMLQSVALQLQGKKPIVSQHQSQGGSQGHSQRVSAHDKLSPPYVAPGRNHGNRDDRGVQRGNDPHGRPLVHPTTRHQPRCDDIEEGRAESEYRDARVLDRFRCFSSRPNAVCLPYKFKPTNHTKYDGKTDPNQWLRIYSQSVELAGGDDDVKALFFPMARKSHSAGLTSLQPG